MLSVEKMLIISAFKGFQAENVIVYVAGVKAGMSPLSGGRKHCVTLHGM